MLASPPTPHTASPCPRHPPSPALALAFPRHTGADRCGGRGHCHPWTRRSGTGQCSPHLGPAGPSTGHGPRAPAPPTAGTSSDPPGGQGDDRKAENTIGGRAGSDSELKIFFRGSKARPDPPKCIKINISKSFLLISPHSSLLRPPPAHSVPARLVRLTSRRKDHKGVMPAVLFGDGRDVNSDGGLAWNPQEIFG